QSLLSLALAEPDVATDGRPVPAVDALHVARDLRVQQFRIHARGQARRSLADQSASDPFLRKLRRAEYLAPRQGGGAAKEAHGLPVVTLALLEVRPELQDSRVIGLPGCGGAPQQPARFVHVAARQRRVDGAAQRTAVVRDP